MLFWNSFKINSAFLEWFHESTELSFMLIGEVVDWKGVVINAAITEGEFSSFNVGLNVNYVTQRRLLIGNLLTL